MAEGIEGGSTGDGEGVRAQLRNRWELASVLHFLRVFRPVISRKLEVTAEEVEEGLIRPDDVLAQIHVALLKGIPPVGKNVEAPDMWVTLVCKQIDLWWTWVGEGDAPITANRGVEVSMYKNMDPISRLMILKALCEIRVVQDDIIAYIDETLKKGTPPSTFCKEKIGRDSEGYDYWWDGDNVMGYRLYRGSMVPHSKQKLKGSNCSADEINFLNETLACDLKQFREIADKLSESKAYEDVNIANVLEDEVIPLVEKLCKKKERAEIRQQRLALQLTGFSEAAVGSRRSCRDRNPARYTFDEYDRSIDEALQIERKRKAADMHSGLANTTQTTLQEGNNGDKHMASDSEEDGDYNQGNDSTDDSDDSDSDDSEEENDNSAPEQTKPVKTIDTTGLRRSSRNIPYAGHPSCAASNGHVEMKKRLRQNHNTDCSLHTVTDSEYEDSDDEMGKPVDGLLHTVEGVSSPAATVR